MERFHIITLLVATVTLIILLTISGILLHNDKRSQKFPPTHAKCPDGWTHTAGEGDNPGSCSADVDNYNRGTLADDYTSHNLEKDPCVNKQWADTNGVYWDGLTTYNGC